MARSPLTNISVSLHVDSFLIVTPFVCVCVWCHVSLLNVAMGLHWSVIVTFHGHTHWIINIINKLSRCRIELSKQSSFIIVI